MNNFLSHNKQIGKLGENLATKFLMKRGFCILDRNYGKKWGEIDIVAEKDKIIHFVEVKTVSYETGDLRPEDNVHYWKYKRLSRVIQTYLLDKRVSYETEWQIDVLAVFVNIKKLKAKIKTIANVIF